VTDDPFVAALRISSPYIHAHRGRTFVIAFGGEAVADATFPSIIHDLALLNSLGVRLVLVHGTRPQIEERLARRAVHTSYVQGLRVTDQLALECVKEAAGTVRVEIEALFSMGLANSPMASARVRIASGNFVTARPLGVRDGVDFCHTGEVRRIDSRAIGQRLDEDAIVLVSPLGYSPTGEVFNLGADEVAVAIGSALRADKLVYLIEDDGLPDDSGELLRQLSPREAEDISRRTVDPFHYGARILSAAVEACRSGVRRTHLVSRRRDGALLRELFTRDGAGTMITGEQYEVIRGAGIDDLAGILELIRPMETQGVLVRRSREHLEMEIDRFTVIERDGTVVACAALYPFVAERMAELACVAVHPDYRGDHRGDNLLENIERKARARGIERLFVLTTRTAHWFRERGFEAMRLEDLPVTRRTLYNYQRRSKLFCKTL
jgi:amino-acid N-acetyltransferase